MKIINVIQDFNVGGIQKLLLEYLRHFKNNKDIDYRVVVLEQKYGSIFDDFCEKENLKIIYLNSYQSKNKHYYIRKIHNWWSYNHPLKKYLKKERPDVVHTHNTRIFIRIQSCVKHLHKKYKWFHTLHSDPYAVAECHIPIVKKMFFEYGVRPICLNETQFLKAKERYGLKSCLYLYNCLDFSKYKLNIIPANKFRKQLEIPENHLLIGCVGRIDPVKNYSFFLDVMNEIVKTNPYVTAIIAGDDSDAEDVKAKIKEYSLEEKVRLLGVRNDVQNIYNCIDRFVQTSLTEASTISVIEAQYFEKKCIVATSVPVESVIKQDSVVRLSLNVSLETWAKEIISPKTFEKKYASISDYLIDNVSKKMIELYNGIKNEL